MEILIIVIVILIIILLCVSRSSSKSVAEVQEVDNKLREKTNSNTESIGDEIKDNLCWINETEKESRKERWGVAPAPYERLAILYRKKKDYVSEVKILERYQKQIKAPGVKPERLKERLQKAKKLLEKSLEND